MLDKKCGFALLGLIMSLPALAERPVPDQEYGCQVVTTSGASGIIYVTSFSRDRAMEVVKGQSAVTIKGTREPIVSTVQCIVRHSDERFSDTYFQAFVDKLAG